MFSQTDFKSLQYIAGYIVHKMNTKFKFSKNYRSDHSLQTLSILKAFKVEYDDSQTLVNHRWFVEGKQGNARYFH